jgi:hypothetical protein
MMREIYKGGPIVCSISTPEDFTYGYRAGIWPDEKTTIEMIDHNVEARSPRGPARGVSAGGGGAVLHRLSH